ncbi:MAG: type II toxin-antitoxin system VapC family toxin [Dehalococcoidia bacterium]
MALYLDASALVKLILTEAETPALVAYLRERAIRYSAGIAYTEVLRAVRRQRPHLVSVAMRALGGLNLIDIDDTLLARAATVDPPEVRSLDAIHIAAALTLEDELDAFVTYDRRMAEAAQAAGLRVEAPAP